MTTTTAVTDRLELDLQLVPAGWAQFDTGSDARWYGVWADPVGLQVLTYCEGDITTTTTTTGPAFAAEVRRIAAWHREHSTFHGIDTGANPAREQNWIDLGLGDLLH